MESYEIRYKFLNPKTGYWEHATKVMKGYETKNDHVQVSFDLRYQLRIQGIEDVLVTSVIYM